MKSVLFAALMLACWVLPIVSAAQAQDSAPLLEQTLQQLDTWDEQAAKVAERIEAGGLTNEALTQMRETISRQRDELPALLTEVATRLAPLEAQLAALGDPPAEGEVEAEEVARERAALLAQLATLRGLERRLSQSDARAEGLTTRMIELRRQNFMEQLLERGPSVLEEPPLEHGLATIWVLAETIYREVEDRLARRSMGVQAIGSIAALVFVIAAPIALVLLVRRIVLRRLARLKKNGITAGRLVLLGLALTLLRIVLPAIAAIAMLGGLMATGLLGPNGLAFAEGALRTSLLVAITYAVGSAFFAPLTPALRLSDLDDRAAASAVRWMMMLALVIGLDRMFIEGVSGITVSVEGLAAINLYLLIGGGIAVWRIERVLRAGLREEEVPAADDAEDETSRSERFTLAILPLLARLAGYALVAAIIIAPILAASGYFAASRFAFYTPVFTAALICLLVMTHVIVRAIVTDFLIPSVDANKGPASAFQILPVAVGFGLSIAAVPITALIWGADAGDLNAAWREFIDGFMIGTIRIKPGDFGLFLLVFGIGYLVTRITQGVVSRSVLPLTRLDSGGRDAVLAALGYLGIFLAALAAIGTTGLDFSNIAIVAGALSVGIGFGLQNIINNFVSGLILLFERPIKAGDWIDLPSGTGYVKRVNVRSTEIETFDRATLFVPNSELISNTLTNWTHQNLVGRVIVAVHVAHGTDLRRVETILLEIAKAHPMMLRKPAPYVLFRHFGESALHFEIRGFLRDVNWILNVQSDINFEIWRRFSEQGIMIPFPQRDLHVRTPEMAAIPLAEALRESSPAPHRPLPDEPAGMGDGDAPGDGGSR